MSSPVVIALAGLTALGVAMGIGRFAFTPILPMMQQDAAVSVGEGGWLASANYLGYLLGALSAVGLRVRATTEARSIRIRRLTPEQRLIVDELLSLPPEDYVLIRGAIEKLRMKRTKKRSRGARR